jgi:hypothetical protein
MPFRFNPLTGSLDYYSIPSVVSFEGDTNGLVIEGNSIRIELASETTSGAISAEDYTEFKSKKEYKTTFDSIILTTTHIADKKVTLTKVPAFPETTMLTLEGGALQRYGVDYTINIQDIEWNGLGLDNFLEPGDILQIYYQTE